ncbi:hypothetical protein [Stieleria varia]|uniref:Uncharacterized protein n=1 Tax=Stieleria varia TaxID=2528005 RepID=A0A5C6ARE5_9BACT|nr:hypothetical protein [Stieleria varia]TWU02300.1 hypothetical protein Pla52n_33500 [Stieleria varia]
MRSCFCALAASVLFIGVPQIVNAQPGRTARFELVDGAGQVSATVEIASGRLIAYEANGERVYYSRAPQYDSADRRYVGYFQYELNRILRFPRSGRGRMQGADLDDPFPQYNYLLRTVRPIIGGVGSPPSAYVPPTQYAYPFQGLGAGSSGYGGGWGDPGLYPDLYPGGSPGYSSGYSTGAGWAIPPFRAPLRRAPVSVLLDSQLVPHPPLAPVTLKLVNGGPREIRVTIDDLTDQSQSRQLRIPSRGSELVQFKRDSGADLVQHYRTVMADGAAVTREIVEPVPPQVLYELVVHEWNLQSIAIDRTGKSPQAIEDIHYQGKGLGRFPLPPGDQLKSGTVDVYRAAKQADNPGAVSPILTRPMDGASESQGLSPLERMLEEQRRATQR